MARWFKKTAGRGLIRVLAAVFAAAVVFAGCSENGGLGTVTGDGGVTPPPGCIAPPLAVKYLSTGDLERFAGSFPYDTVSSHSAAWITDRQGLEKYRGICAAGSPGECLATLDGYTDSYFETRRLIAVVITAPSGSYRYEVMSTGFENGRNSPFAVSVDEIRPYGGAGTADVKIWLALVETDAYSPVGAQLVVRVKGRVEGGSEAIKVSAHSLTPSNKGDGEYVRKFFAYSDDWNYGGELIADPQRLKIHYEACVSGWLGRDEKIYDSECLAALDRYNDSYFETRRLIAVTLVAGSGSHLYEVAEVLRENWDESFTVNINQIMPNGGLGTDDMKSWFILIELDGTYPAGKRVTVNVTRVVID